VPIADRLVPISSPSQCPGTARSAASADHHLACDEALAARADASPRDAKRPAGPQARGQLAGQRAAAPHEQRSADRLVGDPCQLAMRPCENGGLGRLGCGLPIVGAPTPALCMSLFSCEMAAAKSGEDAGAPDVATAGDSRSRHMSSASHDRVRVAHSAPTTLPANSTRVSHHQPTSRARLKTSVDPFAAEPVVRSSRVPRRSVAAARGSRCSGARATRRSPQVRFASPHAAA
jgi:hypothetical protein